MGLTFYLKIGQSLYCQVFIDILFIMCVLVHQCISKGVAFTSFVSNLKGRTPSPKICSVMSGMPFPLGVTLITASWNNCQSCLHSRIPRIKHKTNMVLSHLMAVLVVCSGTHALSTNTDDNRGLRNKHLIIETEWWHPFMTYDTDENGTAINYRVVQKNPPAY